MGKILEFKECSSEDWKRRFSSKEEIAELLNSIRIDDCELKDIMNTYLIDHNRLVVIARVRKKANGRLKKIVIDVKTGEPTFQQMMDLTFNLGSDSDKRVVVFDGSKVTEEIRDPGADRDMIQSFAQITNDCGVSTNVVF